MLVLSRKLNEQIKIGDDITITVVKLRNNQIRIGIDAPREVRVLRGELAAAVNSDPKKQESLRPALLEKPAPSPQPIARFNTDTSMPASDEMSHLPAPSPTQNPVRRNEVVDGLQCAADMMTEGTDDLTASDRSVSAESKGSQPLRVFMGRVKVNAPSSIMPADPSDHFMTAT